MSRYVQRIISAYESNPNLTLKEARGRHPQQQYAYRTSFVLKLPVKGRWVTIRRTITRLKPIDRDSETDKFLKYAGKVIKSNAYAVESKSLLGIEDNVEIPREEPFEFGTEDDDYDEGSTD